MIKFIFSCSEALKAWDPTTEMGNIVYTWVLFNSLHLHVHVRLDTVQEELVGRVIVQNKFKVRPWSSSLTTFFFLLLVIMKAQIMLWWSVEYLQTWFPHHRYKLCYKTGWTKYICKNEGTWQRCAVKSLKVQSWHFHKKDRQTFH